MEETEPFYSINLERVGKSVRFQTRNELSHWANRQKELWATVFDGLRPPPTRPLQNLFGRVNGLVERLTSAAHVYATSGGQEAREVLDQEFRQAYEKSRLPVEPESFIAFIHQLRETHGEAAAASAVASLAFAAPNVPFELSTPAARIGLVSAMLFDLGVDPKTQSAYAEGLKNLTEEYRASINALAEDRANFKAAASGALLAQSEEVKQQRLQEQEIFEAAIAKLEADKKNALESIAATEAAYIEQMQLQAAVTYWTGQGNAHRDSEKSVLRWLVGYGAVAGIGLLVLLHELTKMASQAIIADNPAVYVKYAVIGILATTLAIWIGRILLKVVLSERHLAIDAEERVTMVKTYLALTKEGTLEPADRPLVLAALFRSSSDGIIKDDGGPDTMLTAILGRTLDKLGPR